MDLPEVSLVAVIDADKEGFLRSKTSLLQVAGRAARNVNGRVILYGDKLTEAMSNLLKETDRRRDLQNKFNVKNNITPKTIKKSLDDIMNTTSVAGNDNSSIDKDDIIFDKIEKEDIEMVLLELRKEMIQSAEQLKFERAAKIRDEINKLEGNKEVNIL